MNCTDDTSDSMINLYKGDGKQVKLDAASSTFNLPFFYTNIRLANDFL